MFGAGGGVQRLGPESLDRVRIESFDLHVGVARRGESLEVVLLDYLPRSQQCILAVREDAFLTLGIPLHLCR